MRILKWVLLILLAVVLLVLAGFTIWAYTPLGPMPEAIAALQSDAQVQVETSPWLTFTPAGTQPTTGFIFYPGGRVDPRSYAPRGARPRRAGLPGDDRAHAVQPGGVQAGRGGCRDRGTSRDHELGHRRALPGRRDGCELRLHPSRCGAGDGAVGGLPGGQQQPGGPAAPCRLDLRHERRVGSPVRGGRHPALLPADTRYVPIEGGNHAQMGWYGPQPGDGTATISREEQQQQVVAATDGIACDGGQVACCHIPRGAVAECRQRRGIGSQRDGVTVQPDPGAMDRSRVCVFGLIAAELRNRYA